MPLKHSSWFAHQLQGLINRGNRSLTSMSQPSHRFVLFGTAFSGGHIAIDLLQQVVIDASQGPLPPTWTIKPLLEQRHFFPLRHIQRYESACSDYLFGFSLSATDLIHTHGMNEPSRFMTILYEQGYKVIHLQRRDLMRHAIALLKAQHPHTHHINPQALIDTFIYLDEQRLTEAAIVSQVPHLNIIYETDLIDPNVHNATAQRLCRFLGLKQRRQVPYSIKLVHQRISDLISNYDEVCATLENSEYSYVLTETTAKLVI